VGQEPDRIRAEIEQTRAEMSETVDALGYKADVKSRAKENLQDKKESAKESIMGVKDKIVGAGDSVTSKVSDAGGSVTGTVSDRTPDAEQVKYQARRAASVAQQNPIGLAIGSVAVGFLAGMLLPSTRVEDEKLGEMSDNVIDKVKETGQEALEHGKQVAQDAAQAAQSTAKESGQEHAQQVKDSAQQSAQEATSSSDRPQMSTYQTH
jgi:gas vesicle protein